VLHAAHANQTDACRSCLTLWYFPTFDDLPEPVRAVVARGRPWPPADVPWSDDLARLEPLIPRYDGDASPVAWNRRPGIYLR
jgi:hypothetical protein